MVFLFSLLMYSCFFSFVSFLRVLTVGEYTDLDCYIELLHHFDILSTIKTFTNIKSFIAPVTTLASRQKDKYGVSCLQFGGLSGIN